MLKTDLNLLSAVAFEVPEASAHFQGRKGHAMGSGSCSRPGEETSRLETVAQQQCRRMPLCQ